MYGQTELSPICFQNLPNDNQELRATTVGYPMEHLEIKLVDAEGSIVPVGAEGEMCVRGYNLMAGYWEDPVKIKETSDSTGWLHTGYTN
jgi:fatty-acyl-CoA synthase